MFYTIEDLPEPYQSNMKYFVITIHEFIHSNCEDESELEIAENKIVKNILDLIQKNYNLILKTSEN